MWNCPNCKSEIEDDSSITCWNCGLDSEDHKINNSTTSLIKCDKCNSCGSNKIIKDMIVFDNSQKWDQELKIGFHADENALIFKNTIKGSVSGNVCCECGKIELYCMGDLDRMWNAYNSSGNIKY